jgi:hypothetical protein
MAKKKTSYSELCDAISEKVKQNGISSFSRTDLVSMAHSMVNCPEHEVEIIVKGKDGAAPEKVTTTPVKRYRNSLRPVLSAFGIDKNEQDRILDVPLTREHAEALTDVALNLTKDFIGTGRKLLLPMTSTTESQMAISEVNVPSKTSEPRKIVKENDGSYSSVPTGKKVTTAAHSAVKASNKIPYWLKKSK